VTNLIKTLRQLARIKLSPNLVKVYFTSQCRHLSRILIWQAVGHVTSKPLVKMQDYCEELLSVHVQKSAGAIDLHYLHN
jgi:hypothetical protein